MLVVVHSFSPCDYVKSFPVPSLTTNKTKQCDQNNKKTLLLNENNNILSYFTIPLKSINSYIRNCPLVIINNKEKNNELLLVNTKEKERVSDVEIILDSLFSFGTNNDTDERNMSLFLSEELQEGINNDSKLSDIENEDIDVFTIAQMKLSQLSDHIQPLLQYHKRCRGSGSRQFPAELYFFEDMLDDPSICQRGVVYTDNCQIWNNSCGSYYLPPSSCFYWGDVRVGLRYFSILKRQQEDNNEMFRHLESLFDHSTIVLDPPWRNKSARRGKKYQMGFSNIDLLNLKDDIVRLMDPKGCIVAVWVTNNNTLSFVKESLFPNWGVQYLGVWWWLKINVTGETLHNLISNNKKSYERVVVGYWGTHQLYTKSLCHFYDIFQQNAEDHGVLETRCTKRCHEVMSKSYSGDENKSTKCKSCDYRIDFCSKKFQSVEFVSLPGYTLSCSQNCPYNNVSSIEEDNTNDKELISEENNKPKTYNFPIHIITSIPLRHSWKPPLQNLLQFILKDISLHNEIVSDAKCNMNSRAAAFEESYEKKNRDLELFAR